MPAVSIALAWALYLPSLRIGLLADDFVLIQWAIDSELSPRSWQFFRPLPLLLWSRIVAVTSYEFAPIALHVLSIVLHGLNGFLVGKLGQRVGLGMSGAMLAAVLFVANPLSVEAVAWPSAIGDVLLTTIILAAVLCATNHRIGAGWLLFVVGLLTAAALATKETAVASTAIFLLMAAIVPNSRRRLLTGAAVALCVLVIYMVMRTVTARMPAHPGVEQADVQAVLQQPFASFLFPFHEVVRANQPVLAVIWVACLLSLFLMTVALIRSRGQVS